MLVREACGRCSTPARRSSSSVWAGWGMYEAWVAPRRWVRDGIGIVSPPLRRRGNDATVKAGRGSRSPARNLRAQEIALENRLPWSTCHSAGVSPLRRNLPDKSIWARVLHNAAYRLRGSYQIAAIMGPCVRAALLPIMSDEALIVEGTGRSLAAAAGRAAIGEQSTREHWAARK